VKNDKHSKYLPLLEI